jgi:hypothetical protein
MKLSILLISLPLLMLAGLPIVAAGSVTEVESLILCTQRNTVDSNLNDLNTAIASQDVTENVSDGKLHIKDFNASAPSITFDRYGYPVICVTLTRKRPRMA